MHLHVGKWARTDQIRLGIRLTFRYPGTSSSSRLSLEHICAIAACITASNKKWLLLVVSPSIPEMIEQHGIIRLKTLPMLYGVRLAIRSCYCNCAHMRLPLRRCPSRMIVDGEGCGNLVINIRLIIECGAFAPHDKCVAKANDIHGVLLNIIRKFWKYPIFTYMPLFSFANICKGPSSSWRLHRHLCRCLRIVSSLILRTIESRCFKSYPTDDPYHQSLSDIMLG